MVVRFRKSALKALFRRVVIAVMEVKARLSGQSASARRHARIYELFQDLYDLPPAEQEKLLERLRKKSEADYLEMRSLLKEAKPPEPPRSQPALRPGQSVGRYEILEYIARGGMSEVYKVSHPELGVRVLKILLPEISENAALVEILRREARAAASLNHRHIVTIHDFDEQDDLNYIVMEFVEGQSLRKLIGSLSVKEAVVYARQMATALSFAHSRGIIHRDIKPENVIVRPDGDIKILDFGLARPVRMNPESAAALSVRPDHATPGSDSLVHMGTLPYMAPEQLNLREATPLSDIWSWGVVLYEMLAGRRPFEASTDYERMEAIRSREPGQPSRHKDLNRVALKALRKKPEDRYQTMAAAEGELRVPPTPNWLKRIAAVLLILPVILIGWRIYLDMVNPKLRTVGEDVQLPLIGKEINGKISKGHAARPAIARTKARVVYTVERNGESELWLVEINKRGAPESSRVIGRSFEGRFSAVFVRNDEQILYFLLQNITYGTGILFRMRLPDVMDTSAHGFFPYDSNGTLFDFSVKANPCESSPREMASLSWYHRFSGGGRFEPVCPGGPNEKPGDDESMDSPPDFSPDGKHFVFFSVNGNTLKQSLIIADVNGGEETFIAKDFTPSYYFPLWSPDGSKILIAKRVASETELLLYSLKNGHPTSGFKSIHLPNLLLRGKPAWLNYGRSIIASAFINGPSHPKLLQIFLDSGPFFPNRRPYIELRSDEFRDLDSVTCARNPFESCEETVTAAKEEDSAVVWIVDLADGKKTRITEKGSFSGIAWRDNDHVITESQYAGKPDLILLNANRMDVPTPITNDDSREADPIISPDGRYLVYTSNKEEGRGIHLWRIDLTDRHWRPSQLTFGGSDDDHAAISADSQWVIFSSAATGKPLGYQYLWKIPILGGKAEQITAGPGRNASSSIDDEILYESLIDDGNGQKRWVIAILDKNSPFRDVAVRTRVRWSQDGKGILFVKKQNGVEEIWKKPVDGGPAVRFAPFGEERIFAFALSPDGRRIACVGGDEKSAQIVDMRLAR